MLAIRAALQHDLISSFAAVLVAAYGLGSYRRAARRYARWLGWAALAGAVFVVATSGGSRMEGAPLALLGAAFVLGDAASARRAESAAAVETAHQAERTRIARELHDVVAHQLSAIAVQAGAARLAAAGAADPVIGTVEQLSREALAELNHLLGALRQEPDASPARTATPSLAGLDGLLAASRAAGTPVRLAVTGQPDALPPGVSLSGYRIIQEALANVARHAPRAADHGDAELRRRAARGGDRQRGTAGRAAAGPRRTGRPAAVACAACGSGPSCTAGSWPRAPSPAAVSRCGRSIPYAPRRAAAGMTGTAGIRVVIADDQALVRAGAGHAAGQPARAGRGRPGGRRPAGGAAGQRAAAGHRADGHPDAGAGRDRGHPAHRHRRLGQAPARVVILTTYDLDEYVYQALHAGACGFLLKHAPPEELLLGVRAAADGGALLSPAVTSRLLAEFTSRRPAPARPPGALDRLTAREREVLDLVIRGRSNAEIAGQLVVTQSTVKTHLGHILDKLGLRDRVQAVVFGYEHGLVEPGRRGPG